MIYTTEPTASLSKDTPLCIKQLHASFDNGG